MILVRTAGRRLMVELGVAQVAARCDTRLSGGAVASGPRVDSSCRG